MRLLLDTQILIWLAIGEDRLPKAAAEMIGNEANELLFSVVSLWEVVVKRGLGRADFKIEPMQFRRGLIDFGFQEITISADHAFEVGRLPPLHRDPFDRMLVAQAIAEGATLMSADKLVAQYPGPIRGV